MTLFYFDSLIFNTLLQQLYLQLLPIKCVRELLATSATTRPRVVEVQLLQQLTGHPDWSHETEGWKLLVAYAGTAAPSEGLADFVRDQAPEIRGVQGVVLFFRSCSRQ